MKFNPATQKFEPEIPVKKKGKKVKIKWTWELIAVILGLMILFGILFLAIYFSV